MPRDPRPVPSRPQVLLDGLPNGCLSRTSGAELESVGAVPRAHAPGAVGKGPAGPCEDEAVSRGDSYLRRSKRERRHGSADVFQQADPEPKQQPKAPLVTQGVMSPSFPLGRRPTPDDLLRSGRRGLGGGGGWQRVA